MPNDASTHGSGRLKGRIENWTNQVHQGDAFDLLSDLPTESVHAVVTDPPYNMEHGSGINGKEWDAVGDAEAYKRWNERWATEALRVLKPGGHIVSFGGANTHHRLVCGIEDAGASIEEEVQFLHARGMPKGHNQAPKIDKLLGEEGEYGEAKTERYESNLKTGSAGTPTGAYSRAWLKNEDVVERNAREYIPESEEAQRFDGFQRDLKPAHEPITIARKPIPDASIAENLLEHGVGALNINECRIPSEDKDHDRYPPDVVLDEAVAAGLDAQHGEVSEGHWPASRDGHDGETFNGETSGFAGQSGLPERVATPSGPSRYFYGAKASKAEKTLGGAIENDHPTVKPLDVVEWLVKLVTVEGQVVLDPFAGSGTMCLAAKNVGRKFVGIELDERFADIARARIGLDVEEPSRLLGDESQMTLIQTDGGETAAVQDTGRDREKGD